MILRTLLLTSLLLLASGAHANEPCEILLGIGENLIELQAGGASIELARDALDNNEFLMELAESIWTLEPTDSLQELNMRKFVFKELLRVHCYEPAGGMMM